MVLTAVNSKSFWRAYVEENNGGATWYFGAGAASTTDHSATEPANSAALTADNAPFNVKQNSPWHESLQIAEEMAGQSGSTKHTFISGKDGYDGKRIQYVQNATWIDRVIALHTNEGLLPRKSWAEVFYASIGLYAAYGNFITKYVLDCPSISLGDKAYLKEEIDYRAYLVKAIATPANFANAVAWATTAPYLTKDVVMTYDGVDYKIDSLKLTIVPVYAKGVGAGALEQKWPYFTKFESIEVEFVSQWYDSEHASDLLATVTTNLLNTLTITGWGKTLTLAEMKLKNKSLNIHEMPEKGEKQFSGTFEMGGATAPAIA